ncbi:alpha/beta hydrolase [Niastella caeni]|uniref:Alpha/beta hydrolase n=1 Tax=Niastella caeni TaxID=2569763 RepID=A0A4S8HJB8_9BACT|nr:alpha/beta hydrolase [Niastella caeni]THU32932.1 alpha/beta hydrolase [Niastella caeni]
MRLLPYALLLLVLSCSKNDDDPAQPLTALQNVQYGSAADSGGQTTSLLMDLYFPAGATTADKYPLVLMIHGGGFTSGDKNDIKTHCRILADSGFVTASINYRLGWRTGSGSCNGDTASKRLAVYRAIQDANAALRFLVSKSNSYAIDTNWIFIGGSSAGSGTALTTAYIPDAVAQQLTPTERTLLGPLNTSGNSLTNGFTIKGVANLWGALPDSSLVTAVTARAMISFHGTSDNVVPYDFGYANKCSNYALEFGAACLTRRLHAVHVPYQLYLKTGAGHGPDQYGPGFTMPRTAAFFKQICRGEVIVNKVVVD